MRFLFIVVTDPSPASRDHLEALLSSLERQAEVGDIVLVMRGGGPDGPHTSGILQIHQVDSPLRISASRARNLGLGHAARSGLLDEPGIVAFPDDDARYPDGLLVHVADALDDQTAMVCGPYAPNATSVNRRRFPPTERELTPGLVMRVACTSNVFLRTRVVRTVGCFDESLGLGARYGSSEDTDYMLRALALGFRGVYRPQGVLVEHPYKPSRPSQYYTGNVAVLAKHALGGGTCLLLARRLASGLVLVLRRMITPRDYARAVWAAGCLLVGSRGFLTRLRRSPR